MNKEILPYVFAYVGGTLIGSIAVAGAIKLVFSNKQESKAAVPEYNSMWEELQANIN